MKLSTLIGAGQRVHCRIQLLCHVRYDINKYNLFVIETDLRQSTSVQEVKFRLLNVESFPMTGR